MLKWPLWILSKIGTVCLAGYVAWLGWENLGPRKPDLGSPRKELAEQVIANIVEALETYPSGAKIDVEVNLTDVATGQTLLSKRYARETTAGQSLVAGVQEGAQRFPWFQRFLGWLIAVLLLPVFTLGFMRAMIRKGSNGANLFVLSIYAVADVVLAWLLVGAALGSWWTVLFFIAGVGAAFAYNVRVMTFALKLET